MSSYNTTHPNQHPLVLQSPPLLPTNQQNILDTTTPTPNRTNTPSDKSSSLLPQTPTLTYVNNDFLTAENLLVGNIFNTKQDACYSVYMYHKNIGKNCRLYKSNNLVVHHICLEKYQQKRNHNKSWDEVSHLCSAEHICRRVKGES